MTNEALVARYQKKHDAADLEALYTQNQGLIRMITVRYCGFCDEEDLRQEAFLGLARAAAFYDPKAGFKFTTYAATVIRSAVLRYLDNCGGLVRVPVNVREAARKYKRFCDDFYAASGHWPSDRDVINELKLSPTTLCRIKEASAVDAPLSLDAPTTEDLTLADTIKDDRDSFDKVEKGSPDDVWRVLAALDNDEATAVRLFFLDDLTAAEVGKRLKTNGQKANVIKNRALDKLRKTDGLRAYLEDLAESIGFNQSGLSAFRHNNASSVEMAVMRLNKAAIEALRASSQP